MIYSIVVANLVSDDVFGASTCNFRMSSVDPYDCDKIAFNDLTNYGLPCLCMYRFLGFALARISYILFLNLLSDSFTEFTGMDVSSSTSLSADTSLLSLSWL